MINSIGLRNFKAFGDYDTTVPFAPITLIYGPNSAGKSSIIQALRLIKQSYNQPYEKLFSPQELGSFVDLVSGHDVEREIEIRVGLQLDAADGAPCTYEISSDSSCYYAWSFAHRAHCLASGGRLARYMIKLGEIERFIIDGRTGKSSLLWVPRANEAQLHSQIAERGLFEGDMEAFLSLLNKKYAIAVMRYDESMRQWQLRATSQLPVNRSEILAPAIDKELESLGSALRARMDKFRYIGPVRRDPRIKLSFADAVGEMDSPLDYVGEEGEHLVDILYSDESLRAAVNEWLQADRLGIGYTVDLAEQPSEGGSVLSLTDIHGVSTSLKHVGFGISQLLPIITQAVLGHSQSILIEQPELHIHPRLQAELGDLFIETSRGESGNQYIIETHSETLILRLQRRIREHKLSVDDVSVIYVEPGDNGAQTLELRLDKYVNFID